MKKGCFLFLRIDKFVWARVLCGLRTSCYASVDPSGTSGKILGPKVRQDQGPAADDEDQEFILELYDTSSVTFENVRAWLSDNTKVR